ncbi:MAG: NAD(P)H-dependent oxidoreductase subunit E [Bryobacteraceae bacterium]|jgi:bidirectional [NiFe] hydrogenase diaphorase subunit
MPVAAERQKAARPCCGRHVFVVCTGEECRRQGSERLLHDLQQARATADADIRVSASQCLGHCALAPAMIEDGELLGAVSARRLRTEMARLGIAPA